MVIARPNRKTKIFEFAFAVAAIINSTWIYYVYLSITNIGTYAPANFSKMLDGTADRPFAYRILIPQIAKLLSPFIPANILNWFVHSQDPVKMVFDRFSGNQHPNAAVITMIVMYLSLLGFAFVEKNIVQSLDMHASLQFILPLFAQIMILPQTFPFGYFYDLPQIFLMSLCILFLYGQNWFLYLLFFAITTLNKETTFTLIAVYVIYYFPRPPREKFIKLLLGQVLMYTLIRAWLFILYRDNGGANIQSNFAGNFHIYSAAPALIILTLIYFGVILFSIIKQWNQSHEFLRCGLIIFAIIFAFFVTSGIPMEFRVFLDALPILAFWIFPFGAKYSS
jgi:hypothetical protein